VDAGVFVGNSLTARFRFDENGRHPIAFDLPAVSPRMRDLDDLGYDRSFATAVGQGIMVGQSWTARHSIERALVYDLRAASPRMRDIGTLDGIPIRPHDVNDGVVVGWGYRAENATQRAFAYDIRAPRPQMTDLGTRRTDSGGLGGRRSERRRDVGQRRGGSACDRLNDALHLHSGAAVQQLLVRRDRDSAPRPCHGRPRRPDRARGSVRYRASSATATAGRDFRGASSVLRFAAGEIRKSLYVSVLGNSAREPAESVLLTLTPRGTGAILGTPRTAGLIIAASDQRADASISANALSGSIGNNIISTGTRQTRTLTARRATRSIFAVHVRNDGNAANTFALRGSAVGRGVGCATSWGPRT
jgi:Calx-beta domain-containing protein